MLQPVNLPVVRKYIFSEERIKEMPITVVIKVLLSLIIHRNKPDYILCQPFCSPLTVSGEVMALCVFRRLVIMHQRK